MTGRAMSIELTATLARYTGGWDRVVQRIRDFIDSIRHIWSQQEHDLANGFRVFEEMQTECLENSGNVIRDLEAVGDGAVPIRTRDRRDELLRNFDVADRKLAELNALRQSLANSAREFELNTVGKLLIAVNNLEDAAGEILDLMTALNNETGLKEKTTAWGEKINETWASLERIHKSISSYHSEDNRRDQLNALLTRVEEVHRPPWYLGFLQVVWGDFIQEKRQHQPRLTEYKTSIQELVAEIEQFLDYN